MSGTPEGGRRSLSPDHSSITTPVTPPEPRQTLQRRRSASDVRRSSKAPAEQSVRPVAASASPSEAHLMQQASAAPASSSRGEREKSAVTTGLCRRDDDANPVGSVPARPLPAYVVLGCAGAGQLFMQMQEYLLKERASCWHDGGALESSVLYGQLPAIDGRKQALLPKKGRPTPVASSSSPSSVGTPPPCCDRWAVVSLFLGDKTTAERCLEESRYLALRERRKSSAAPGVRSPANVAGVLCPHQRRLLEIREHMLLSDQIAPPSHVIKDESVPHRSRQGDGVAKAPSHHWNPLSGGGRPRVPPLVRRPSDPKQAFSSTPPSQPSSAPPVPHVPVPSSSITLVNYIEGFKAITLKNRMVKTLRQHFAESGWSTLGAYLPITYQLRPDPNGPTGGSTSHDERVELVQTMCRCNAEEFDASGEIATYWIAKSSHGAHGSNIRIFYADQHGLDHLVRFIDSQRDPFPWVVSRYIDRPLLYNGRKFDIRCWVLVAPNFDVYLHRDLVMRMSSEAYDRTNVTTDNAIGRLANITNHCVQAEGRGYSRFESGNELWRDSLDKLVREHFESGMSKRERRHSRACQSLSMMTTKDHSAADGRSPSCGAETTPTLDNCIVPQITRIIQDSIAAAYPSVPRSSDASQTTAFLHAVYSSSRDGTSDRNAPTGASPPQRRRTVAAFQMLGFDFIIDQSLVVWLLEINGSPGVAQALIHTVVQDAVELVIDPLFPPPPPSSLREGKHAAAGGGSASPRHRRERGERKGPTTAPTRCEDKPRANGFEKIFVGASLTGAAATR